MGFPRQQYWNGLPFHFLGDLPDAGIKPASPALVGRFITTEPPGKIDVDNIDTLLNLFFFFAFYFLGLKNYIQNLIISKDFVVYTLSFHIHSRI